MPLLQGGVDPERNIQIIGVPRKRSGYDASSWGCIHDPKTMGELICCDHQTLLKHQKTWPDLPNWWLISLKGVVDSSYDLAFLVALSGGCFKFLATCYLELTLDNTLQGSGQLVYNESFEEFSKQFHTFPISHVFFCLESSKVEIAFRSMTRKTLQLNIQKLWCFCFTSYLWTPKGSLFFVSPTKKWVLSVSTS